MRWEYLIAVTRNLAISADPSSFGVENVGREETAAEFNEYGSEEWELVALQPGGSEWLAIFKRPRQ